MLPCWPLPCPLAVRKKKLRLLTLLLLRPLKLLLPRLLTLLLRPLMLLLRPLMLLLRLLTLLLPRLLMLLPLRPKKRSSNSCFLNGGFGHHATKTLLTQGFCFGERAIPDQQKPGICSFSCCCLPCCCIPSGTMCLPVCPSLQKQQSIQSPVPVKRVIMNTRQFFVDQVLWDLEADSGFGV
ncbi:hypothetical protein [Laribacter hongkongensis]|uniref:hypothetical protein n=1 Tax=Laribacter hongkongensis TaxID=168471 RepID=UPI001EFCD60C|nr:hypothetical protein [Laribacter hongkongensis]MCG9076649.1 hypothetical protein [Laribacter hongkongensis]